MTVPDPAQNALRAIAGAILRHLLGSIGLWLVHKGWVDQPTADSAIGPLVDFLLGLALSGGALIWAVLRAKASHWRWVRALYAPALPLPPA